MPTHQSGREAVTDDLRAMLIRHEGEVLKVYEDTRGIPTIGVGRNLQDAGISHEEAMVLLDNDISRVSREVRQVFPWTADLDPVRGSALLDMAFNFGVHKFQMFPKFLAAMEAKDWPTAVQELATIHFTSAARRTEITHMIEWGEAA